MTGLVKHKQSRQPHQQHPRASLELLEFLIRQTGIAFRIRFRTRNNAS